MTEVNWGIQGYDPLRPVAQGNAYAQQILDQSAQQKAGQLYVAGDYTGASNAIGARGNDFKTAEALRGIPQQRAAEASDQKIKQATAQHDYLKQAVPLLGAIYSSKGPQALNDAFQRLGPDLKGFGTDDQLMGLLTQSFQTDPEGTLRKLGGLAQSVPHQVGKDLVFVDPVTNKEVTRIKGGQDAPSGFETAPSGGLQPIKGGPGDPAYIQKNAETRREVIINNPTAAGGGNQDAGWQLANDPTTNTQYRINVRTGKTIGLDGAPYKPKGASKISTGAGRSGLALAMQKFTQENPGASADDIARFAGNYARTVTQIGGEAKSDTAALTQLTKMGTAASSQEQALNTAIGQIETLMNKGAGTSMGPIVNRWLQGGRKATGDPDVASFNTAVETAANEYAKIITGSTGATDASRLEAAGMLDKFQNPKAILAQIEVIRKDAHGKIQSYMDHSDFIRQKLNEGRSGTSMPSETTPAQAAPPIAPTAGGWKIERVQ